MWKYLASVLFLILVQVCRVNAQNITITVTDQFYNCSNGSLSFSYHVSVVDGVNSPNLSTFYGTIVGSTSSGAASSGDSEYDGYFSGQWTIGQPVTIWAEGYNNNSAPRKEYAFAPDYSNDLIKPTITTSNIPLCGSTVGTMTANGYGGTFVWNNGAIGAVYNVNETGTYSVHLSNYCGVSPESDPVVVTNGSTPPAPSILASPGTVLCNGSSTGLYASPSAGGTIHWSTGETGNMITVSTAGNYYAYEVNGCGQGENSSIVTITAVNTSDVPTISSSNGTTLCNGASTTLTAVSAHGGTVYWSTGQTGNSITVSSVGSYNAYEGNACGTSNYSNTISITTLSTPAAPTIATNQNTLLCDGATATLFVPSPAGTVNWNTGATGTSITTGSAGSYYANQSNACGTSGNSNTIVCTIGSTPAPPNISPAGPIQLCNGNSVTLTIPGGGNTNWFLNGGLISANSGNQSVSSPGSYTATLNNACGISAPGPAVIVTTGSSPIAPSISSGSTIICNGSPVTISTSPFGGGTIHWNTGATGNSISVSSPGTYYAYESNSCGNSPNSNSINISSANTPPVPSLNVTGSITLCNGASQIISTSPSAGGTIHWNTGATGNSISVNSAGSYYAYETNGCGNSGNSASVNISTLSNPVAPTVTPPGSQLLCNGQTISFNASGSSITWSNGATGNNMVTGIAGTYYAYDHNVCGNSPNSNSVVITTGNCPTPSPGTSFFICPGALKTLDAGAGYDTYSWSNGATTRNIAVGPGNYAVTVSKNGCFATSVTVSVSYYTVTTPSISASGPTTFCAGNSVTLSSSPASAYLWSNGSTSNSINVTTSGNYFVTITDGNGCQATSSATPVTVNPLATASIGGTTSVCKNSASPSITFNASGGTAPYIFSYNINGGSTQTITTSTNTISVSVPTTTAGTFTYNLLGVRESSSTACFNSVSGAATVIVRDLPTATIAGSTTVCLNSSSPLITFAGSTGTAPYIFTYSINGGANQTITTTSGNSVSISVPTNSAGTYTYSLIGVQESSGLTCANTISGSATVIVKPLPSASISGTTTICQNSAAPSISFTGSGATAPYTFTYKINNGSSQTVTTTSGNSVTVNVPTSSAGTYTYTLVSVQESSGTACVNTASGNATVLVNPLPSATISGTTTVCQNSAAPSITFTGSGATAPYIFTYKVNGGANQTVTTTSGNSVTVSVPTTTAGTYTYSLVSVQESSGVTCSNAVSGSATVTVRDLPTASISGSTTVCLNSASPLITFTGSTGTAPYIFTYSINGGANQTISTTSGNSVSISVPTNSAGTYTYSLIGVQESSGLTCVNTVSGSTTVVVKPLPSASIAGTTTVCQNSSAPLITFTGSGATAPYIFTYKINGGANQTVTTTSGNSVTVSVPTSVAGRYTYSLVSVQESSGVTCSNAASGSATVVVNPLPAAIIAGSVTVCQNSTQPAIIFTGSNATAPYTFTYKINGGANQTVTTSTGNSVTVNVPTGTPGSFVYSLVSVQEASSTSCANTVSGSAIVVVNPLPAATITGSTVVCQNSSSPVVTFTGSGATAPYTFTYKINGGSSQTITTTSGNSVNVSVPTGSAGTYTYTLLGVQESSGTSCINSASGSATVVVNPLPAAIIAGSVTVCQNSTQPAIIFTGSNATAPYTFTYKINGGAIQTVSTTSGNSVSIGVPTGTAGTFVYDLVSVQESSSTSCINSASGSATIVVRQLPTATISGSTAVCMNSTNPLITFTGATGTAPFTFSYKINNGPTQTVATTSGNSVSIQAPASVAGTYIYTLIGVQESSGQTCSNSATGNATVIVNPLPTATIAGSITVCQNSALPPITFTGSNATAPYTFTYKINGGSNQTVSSISGNSVVISVPTNTPGTFTYTLTSVQESSGTACSNAASGSAIVVVNPQPTAAILLAPSTHLCNGDTGQLTIYNWTEGFTYTWYKYGVLFATATGQTMAVTQAGSYTVMVTSNLGCDAPAISNAVILTTGTISTPVITGYLKVCEGGKTKLFVLPTDKNKPYELYRWTDTPIGDTVAWDKSFSAYAGQYRVLVEREGCFDSTVVAVTSNDTEYPAGVLTVSPKNISYGGRVTLVAEVIGASQYQWNLGDSHPAVTLSNKMEQNYYTRSDSVVVNVIAISERNCKTEFSACIKIGKPDSLVIPDHSFTGNLKDWNVFPVPFHNVLKLSVILKRNESIRVDLFSGNGSWVRSWTFKGLKGENLFSLNNIDNLSSGVMYYITAIYNNQKHSDKIYKY